MTDSSSLESTTVTERLVLYELAELDEADETPVQAPAILQGCRDRLEALDDVVGGRLTEADLVRCCRSLHDQGLVDEFEAAPTSPVGKGRPGYGLAADPDDVREAVGQDDRLSDGVGDGMA